MPSISRLESRFGRRTRSSVANVFSFAGLKQGLEDANPEIFPGDVIVVQKAAPVYITGEVDPPGEFEIPEGGLSLTQAIAMASGITREAKPKT